MSSRAGKPLNSQSKCCRPKWRKRWQRKRNRSVGETAGETDLRGVRALLERRQRCIVLSSTDPLGGQGGSVLRLGDRGDERDQRRRICSLRLWRRTGSSLGEFPHAQAARCPAAVLLLRSITKYRSRLCVRSSGRFGDGVPRFLPLVAPGNGFEVRGGQDHDHIAFQAHPFAIFPLPQLLVGCSRGTFRSSMRGPSNLDLAKARVALGIREAQKGLGEPGGKIEEHKALGLCRGAPQPVAQDVDHVQCDVRFLAKQRQEIPPLDGQQVAIW
jgi:hypothetical protein